MKIYFATLPCRQEWCPLSDKGVNNRLTSYFFWGKLKKIFRVYSNRKVKQMKIYFAGTTMIDKRESFIRTWL